jgi:hypothetical protein
VSKYNADLPFYTCVSSSANTSGLCFRPEQYTDSENVGNAMGLTDQRSSLKTHGRATREVRRLVMLVMYNVSFRLSLL